MGQRLLARRAAGPPLGAGPLAGGRRRLAVGGRVLGRPTRRTIQYLPPPPETIDAGPSHAGARRDEQLRPRQLGLVRPATSGGRASGSTTARTGCGCPAHYIWTPARLRLRRRVLGPPAARCAACCSPRSRSRGLDARRLHLPPGVRDAAGLPDRGPVRAPGRADYYFGDYFEPAYQRRGFVPGSTTACRVRRDLNFAYYRHDLRRPRPLGART